MNPFGTQHPHRYMKSAGIKGVSPTSTTADPNSLASLMARGWVLVPDETGKYRLRHPSELDFPIPAPPPPKKQPKASPKRARKSRKPSA